MTSGKRGPYHKAMAYFPVDVGIFDDPKLYPVQEKFGPLGEVVYLRLLCFIYKSGYYLKFDSLDNLAAMVVKSVGNRWLRGIKSAKQVILFLVQCGLFDEGLWRDNVLTSAGVQTRYLRAFPRKQIHKKYWLLGDSPPPEAAPGVANGFENAYILGESADNLDENADTLGEIADKDKRKEKKTKTYDNNDTALSVSENAYTLGENARRFAENACTFTEWPLVLEYVRGKVKPRSYESWFGADTILEALRAGDTVGLLLADEYALAYMDENYTELLRGAICTVTEEELEAVFMVAGA